MRFRMDRGFALLVAVSAINLTSCLAGEAAGVRPSAIAGSWYPEERALVEVEVAQRLAEASSAPSLREKPVALVVPHAGWRFSGAAAAAAFRTLHAGDFSRVVLVAPSHHAAFGGFAVSDKAAYRTPLGDVPVCRDVSTSLADGELARPRPDAEGPEHAVEIELPFLQETLGSFCVVPVLAGQTSAEQEKKLASKLAKLRDGRTLFVFSSDFTHYGPGYGYAPFGPSAPAAREKIRSQNAEAVGLLLRKDAAGFRRYLERTEDTICGRHGLGVLLELLPLVAPDAVGTLLARYASIDIPGFEDDNAVVYVSMAFTGKTPGTGKPMESPPTPLPCPPDAPPLEPALGDAFVGLARAALRTQLLGTDDLAKALSAFPAGRAEAGRLQGVFVTLNRTDPREIEREGRLRGCIGQIFPVLPFRQAVVQAAVSAALHDPRFLPVEAAELARLEVELTVLSPPRPVGSWREIRLGVHGIVLDKQGRRAVFLPQVPGEEGWTVEETLSHLSRKAGLPPDAWKEGASFSVFTGQVFRERPDRAATGPGRKE